MADIQVILAKYKPVIGNVSNGAKSVSVTTPEHIAKTSQPSIPTNFADTSLDVIVENAGETSIPESGIGRFAGDSFSVVESISRQIGKKLEELKTVSDIFSRTVIFQRAFTETETTIEQLIFDTLKGISESFTRIEQVRLETSKVFSDSFVKTDVASFAVEGNYNDLITKSDLVVLNPEKGLVETQITTDVLYPVFTAYRTFVDIVDATDDIFGEANIDDDQVAAVNKAAIDWIAQSDLYLLSTFKVFNDLENFSDIKYFDIIKGQNDLGSLIDLLYFESVKELADTFTSQDQASKDFSKIATDYASNSDAYFISSFKVLYDIGTLSDVSYMQLETMYSDIANESDIVYQDFSKYLSHTFSNNDVSYYLATKGVVEIQLTSEVLSFDLSYNLLDTANSYETLAFDLSKSFSHTFNESDLAVYLVGKQALEVNYTSDFAFFDKNKVLEDIVDATDDVLGEANVDDDQIAAVTKTLADYSATSEDFSRTFTAYRDFSDTTNESDIIYLQPGISKLETTQTSEYKFFGVNTVYNDVESVSDVNNKDLFSVYLDSFDSSDNVQTVTAYLRDFAEIESISETLSRLYLKQLIESTVTSEQFVKTINKDFTDIVTTSESITPINGRAFSEPQDVSDGGTINNQNYFSSDYVEPGYVGTNTYF